MQLGGGVYRFWGFGVESESERNEAETVKQLQQAGHRGFVCNLAILLMGVGAQRPPRNAHADVCLRPEMQTPTTMSALHSQSADAGAHVGTAVQT